MTSPPDALKHLHFGWFAIVMGLSGLSIAWWRAAPLMGDAAEGGALVLGVAAVLAFGALALLSWWRWQRYPDAVAADLRHPVRHALLAAIPISLILLATVGAMLLGAEAPVVGLWWVGVLAQLGVTVWLLARWLRPGKDAGLSWPAVTPALFLPAVGNVLAPLAGPQLGFEGWAAAPFGIGVLLWPVLLALMAVRLATSGAWPERVLPLVFVSVAPPAVIGSALLQLGAPALLAWMAWGAALLFVLWSGSALRRMLAQPFSITFWALSFPLASFAALTLRLAAHSGGAMHTLGVLALALASLVVVSLLIATFKGLRDGTLLQPEVLAPIALAADASPSP